MAKNTGKPCIKGILKKECEAILRTLKKDDLLSLRFTVTGLETAAETEDAIRDIIAGSKSIKELLERKKVTRKVLRNYLKGQEEQVRSNASLSDLVSQILEFLCVDDSNGTPNNQDFESGELTEATGGGPAPKPMSQNTDKVLDRLGKDDVTDVTDVTGSIDTTKQKVLDEIQPSDREISGNPNPQSEGFNMGTKESTGSHTRTTMENLEEKQIQQEIECLETKLKVLKLKNISTKENESANNGN